MKVLFLIIGIIVFAGDFHSFVDNFGATNIWRRWGYWLFIPTILLIALAGMLYPFHVLFKRFIEPRILKKQAQNRQSQAQPPIAPPPALNLTDLKHLPVYLESEAQLSKTRGIIFMI